MTILLGAVGVDIPVKLLQEFSPKYRVCSRFSTE